MQPGRRALWLSLPTAAGPTKRDFLPFSKLTRSVPAFRRLMVWKHQSDKVDIAVSGTRDLSHCHMHSFHTRDQFEPIGIRVLLVCLVVFIRAKQAEDEGRHGNCQDKHKNFSLVHRVLSAWFHCSAVSLGPSLIFKGDRHRSRL